MAASRLKKPLGEIIKMIDALNADTTETDRMIVLYYLAAFGRDDHEIELLIKRIAETTGADWTKAETRKTWRRHFNGAKKWVREYDSIPGEKKAKDDDPRPMILLAAMNADEAIVAAWDALKADCDACLKAGKEPLVFNVAGGPGFVRDGLNGAPPTIEDFDVPTFQDRLMRTTRWMRSGGPNIVPPADLVSIMLGTPRQDQPELYGIDDAPRFGPGLELNLKAGYNAKTKRIYRPKIEVGDTTPTAEAVAWAVDFLLWHVLEGFPYIDNETPEELAALTADVVKGKLEPWQARARVGHSSRAHALCMVLEPFIRPALEGVTPLYTLRKNNKGVGAGFLVKAVARIGFGTDPPPGTAPKDDTEMSKLLLAAVHACASMFVIDNFTGKLESDALATVMTERIYSGRMLQKTQIISGPTDFMRIINGNNVILGSDFIRRAVLVRMHSDHPNPEQRTDFRHNDFENWVRTNRAQAVRAALILIQNHKRMGMVPDETVVLGGFTPWVGLMGGILRDCGLGGRLLANRHVLQTSGADIEADERRELYEAWADEYGEQPAVVGRRPDGLVILPDVHGVIGLLAKFDIGMEGIDVDGPSESSTRKRVADRLGSWDRSPLAISGNRTAAVERVSDTHGKRFMYRLRITETAAPSPPRPRPSFRVGARPRFHEGPSAAKK